jgi:hypothetical protein
MRREDREHPMAAKRRRFGKTALYMILMGFVCAFAAAHMYNLATRMGLSPTAASKLPDWGFFIGLGLGLGIGLVRSIKEIFSALLAMAIMGAVFWFVGVILEAVLVACGVDPDIVGWISKIAFIAGVLIGSLLLYAIIAERVGKVLHPRRDSIPPTR